MSRRNRKAARSVPAAGPGAPRSRSDLPLLLVVLIVIGAAAAGWRALRPPEPDRLNLVLITIDTLRADRVGTTAEQPRRSTPWRPVRPSTRRKRLAVDRPSHATILTGQNPPTHGVRGNVVFTLGDRYPTLATV